MAKAPLPSQNAYIIDYQVRSFYGGQSKYHYPNVDPVYGAYPAYRHNDGINMLFLDGHVEWNSREYVISNLTSLFWNP